MTSIEHMLTVGGPPPLAGILSEPARGGPSRATLILLNSGMMHHVGTCNLSVNIARRTADLGTRAYRFDFSGIGDSRSRSFAGSHDEREVSELREVMDELNRRTGSERFLLCGLCSGADAAMAAAVVDDRVTGIAQIDPYCFRTGRWYLRHYVSRARDMQAWTRLFRRLRGEPVDIDGLPSEYLEELDEQERHNFDKKWLASGYRGLVERGVRTLVVLTRGQSFCYNYEGQFREVFAGVPFGALLDEHYLPDTRHTITGPDDQAFVTRLISDWAVADSGAADENDDVRQMATDRAHDGCQRR